MFSLFSPPTAKKNVTQKRKNLKKQRAEKQSKNDERPLQAVLNQGYELMERHGLSGWTIQFDHARRRAGLCDYNRKILSLSRHYARYASDTRKAKKNGHTDLKKIIQCKEKVRDELDSSDSDASKKSDRSIKKKEKSKEKKKALIDLKVKIEEIQGQIKEIKTKKNDSIVSILKLCV